MNTYNITLKMPSGEKRFKCNSDDYILDAAESAAIDLPFGCRAGACSSCVAKTISGEVDQSEQSYMTDAELKKGYVLLCVGKPKSDCVIETHKEGEV